MSQRSVLAAGPLAALTGLGHKARARTALAEETHPPLGGLLNIDGTKVHFTDQGNGPVLVLIHGAGGNLRDFTFELADKMAKTNRVIAFDRPGHGYTDRLHAKGESPLEQAEILAKALARLGVEQATICGYSLGGAVALAWALMAPQTVQGLLLISAVSHPWPGGVGLLYATAAHLVTAPLVIPGISAFAPDRLVKSTLESVFRPLDPPKGYLDYIGAGLSLRPHSVLANARQVYHLKANVQAMARRYAQLTMPIEILHGEEDRSVYASIHAEQLVHEAKNARYTALPGIGHSPHHHSHDEILTALARLNALQN